MYDGVKPRVDACTAAGRAFRMAACHGLWYVTVMTVRFLFMEKTSFVFFFMPLPSRLWQQAVATGRGRRAWPKTMAAAMAEGHGPRL